MPREAASLLLQEMVVEAWLATVPRDVGMQFLQNLARLAEQRADMRRVVAIRRSGRQVDRAAAERQALAAFREMLEVWMARLRT